MRGGDIRGRASGDRSPRSSGRRHCRAALACPPRGWRAGASKSCPLEQMNILASVDPGTEGAGAKPLRAHGPARQANGRGTRPTAGRALPLGGAAPARRLPHRRRASRLQPRQDFELLRPRHVTSIQRYQSGEPQPARCRIGIGIADHIDAPHCRQRSGRVPPPCSRQQRRRCRGRSRQAPRARSVVMTMLPAGIIAREPGPIR